MSTRRKFVLVAAFGTGLVLSVGIAPLVGVQTDSPTMPSVASMPSPTGTAGAPILSPSPSPTASPPPTAPPPTASPPQIAGKTFYVDGKLGSDSHSGLSAGAAFQTIAKAALSLPDGADAAGWTVVVQGYADYIYRERPIPRGWGRWGTASEPIVFEAAGYEPVVSTYVKPIVSGSDLAPAPGESWEATGTAGVWRTPWATAPFAWGLAWGPRGIAIFEDGSTWLWAVSSLRDLAAAAARGTGGFWWDATGQELYVSAASKTGASGASPAGHTIDVVMRNAFYFSGLYGVRYVQVRGFDVEHSANGIGFAQGTDYGTAEDNIVNGNLYMGIQTAGWQTASGPDPSIGNTIWRNSGSYNTLQAIKADQGTEDSSFCYNSASRNGLQGIKLQGTPVGGDYAGTTSNNTVCYNKLSSQTYNPTASNYNNDSGLTVANGAIDTTVVGNEAWGNDVGIMIVQEYGPRPAIRGVTLSGNKIWSNRRFGLYFFDGFYGNGSGSATSSHDLIWANGLGVMVDRGSTNKKLDHDTIYGNKGDGIHVGSAYQAAVASVTVSASIVSGNGGYGIWSIPGNQATLSHDALPANTNGALRGSVAATAVNYKAPTFVSTISSDPAFLQISSRSYQYTAGPGKSPIGARY